MSFPITSALVDNGGGAFSEIRSSNHTIPRVGSLQDRPDPCREHTQQDEVVAMLVYDLEYREVFNFRTPASGGDRRLTRGSISVVALSTPNGEPKARSLIVSNAR